MHKKLLKKMGLTPEIMIQRHSEGDSFSEEWSRAFLPLLSQCEKENIVIFSFGSEDIKILKKTLSGNLDKKISFIDLSQYFHVIHFGQMGILNGLGVSFTHDFSSFMDVKALYLIHQVFSLCATVEDSRNLQLSLQLHKMYLQSVELEHKEKLKKYLSLALNHPPTKYFFDKALEIAEEMVEEGFFSPPSWS